MPRKRKTSPIKDVSDVIAVLPWWAGVAIAVIGYLVLHRPATPTVITTFQPGQMGNLVAQSIVTAFAYAGQYLVPLVGLIGTAISFFRRKQRVAFFADVAQARSADALDGMSWRKFEMLVGEACQGAGLPRY